MIKLSFFSILCVAAVVASAQTVSDAKRAFRVQDSIEMTRILEPESEPNVADPIRLAYYTAGLRSPDGLYTAVLLTNGDVSNNTNVYRLVVYETATLFDKPVSREVVRMVATSSRPGIVKVKWLSDSRRLAFLGEREHELPQVWMVDRSTGELRQITHHKTAVNDYDITPDGTAWIYSAQPENRADSNEYTERGFVFRWPEQSFTDVLAGRYAPSVPDQFVDVYVGRVGQAASVRVQQRPRSHRVLSIAPDGRHAVEALEIDDPPEEWNRYEGPDLPRLLAAKRDTHNLGVETNLFRYYVIDCATASSKPLLNSPAGWSFVPVLWTADSNEAILFRTFAPLTIPGAAHLGWNNVISVRIDDGAAILVRSELDHNFLAPEDWRPETGRLVLRRGLPAQYSVHIKSGDAWRRIEERMEPQIRIAVKQGLNLPPELEAQEWTPERISRRAVLTHLNPQLDSVTLAEVKALEWTGKDGLSWKAGIYTPPHYEKGTSYPLVIQTHGFSKETFEPDGISTTAMAAQALANSGMVVIQVGSPKGVAPQSLLMASQWTNGIESLIDMLAKQGIVDRDRVGLIGWSYTGWLVEYFLTHSVYPIRAAVTADNIDYGYWGYLAAANRGSLADNFNSMYDGSFWDKPEAWLKNSPPFGLGRIKTPLRMETDQDNPLYHWESFAGLNILHKPVEFVIIPNSPHSLVRPWHRMTSQGGTVDWMDFWLNGHEDSDPAKADQYARWRELRKLQEQNRLTSKEADSSKAH